MKDVADGNEAAAYSKLCRGYTSGVSQPIFARAIKANAFLHASPSFSVTTSRGVGGGGWSLEGPLKTTIGSVGIEVHGGRDDAGQSCITGILIGGTPAFPVPGVTTQPDGG